MSLADLLQGFLLTSRSTVFSLRESKVVAKSARQSRSHHPDVFGSPVDKSFPYTFWLGGMMKPYWCGRPPPPGRQVHSLPQRSGPIFVFPLPGSTVDPNGPTGFTPTPLCPTSQFPGPIFFSFLRLPFPVMRPQVPHFPFFLADGGRSVPSQKV